MALGTLRIVTNLVLQESASIPTLVANFDNEMTLQMNAIIATPPAGYQPGSIRIDGTSPYMIWDGTNYIMWQSFTFQTLTP